MTQENIDLAALIGSRICHDLISPIGAIDNGLELLGMSGIAEGPELSLIAQSVGSASARIRFFRIAFGAAGDQMVGPAEITSILRDLYDSSRLELVWTPADPQPRAAVRLAFLGILCLETAMPYGGRAEVSENNGTWLLEGTADKVSVDADLWGHLAARRTNAPLQPAQVQFALLPVHALDDGRKVVTQAEEAKVSISF
jgi:histidine phosphotransferase ChpT